MGAEFKKMSKFQMFAVTFLSIAFCGCGEPKKPKIGADGGNPYTLEKREKLEPKIGVGLPGLTSAALTSIIQVERLLKMALKQTSGLFTDCQTHQADITDGGQSLTFQIKNENCPMVQILNRSVSWDGQEIFTASFAGSAPGQENPKSILKKSDATNNITIRSESSQQRGRKSLVQTVVLYDDIRIEAVPNRPGVYFFTFGDNAEGSRSNIEMRTQSFRKESPNSPRSNRDQQQTDQARGSGLMNQEERQRIREERQKMSGNNTNTPRRDQRDTNEKMRFHDLLNEPTSSMISLYTSGFVDITKTTWQWTLTESKLRWTQKVGQELMTDTYMNMRPIDDSPMTLNTCGLLTGSFLTATNISFFDVKKEAVYDEIIVDSNSNGTVSVKGDPRAITVQNCESTGYYKLDTVFANIHQNLKISPIYLGRSRPKPQPPRTTPNNKGSTKIDNGKTDSDNKKKTGPSDGKSQNADNSKTDNVAGQRTLPKR